MTSPFSRTFRVLIATTALALGVGLLTAAPASAHGQKTGLTTLVNPDPADWTPQIQDGQVNAIVQIGTKVVVGGTFTQVRRYNNSTILTRNYIFAFDMNTGAIDPNFVPVLNNNVLALAPGPDGTSVYVGGLFNSVNGATYRNLVRLRLSDGQPVAGFKANTNARVQDLQLSNGWLYVSGKFTAVGGVSRSGLARVNPDTGALDPNLDLPFTDPVSGTLGVPEFDISPDGSKLVAIGAFGKVAGQDRVQIAVINLATTPASLSSWQTTDYPIYVPATTTWWCSSSFKNTYLRSVKVSMDGTYFIVSSTGAYRANRLCDTVSRWDLTATGPNQHPTWVDWSGGDTTWSVGMSNAAIYVGGHFRWWNNPYAGDKAGPGAVPREGIAALDPRNGLPFSWNPSHERGVGIFDLPTTPDGLWVGSDTDHAGGEFHQKIAFHPIAGGQGPAPDVTYSLPGDLYNMDQSTGTMFKRSYDLSTFGSTTSVPGINWQNARGAFAVNGRLYYGMTDGGLYSRTFDGSSFGAQQQVNLYGLGTQPSSAFTIPGTTTRVPAFTTDIAAMTGMFYDNGRLYYTVNKSNQTTLNNMLYYRYFNPESEVVGANLFVASTYPADGQVQWGNVRGMTLANGKLIYALTDGRLYSVDWNGSKPTGSPTLISGATTWQSRGMFAYSLPPADTTAPTVPGKPTGTSPSAGAVRITWPGSSDPDSPAITYRVYRDGGANPVGQTTSTTFTDTGLSPGTSHTYRVDAIDPSNNASAQGPASDPVVVSDVVFADDFASGDFSNWTTNTNLTIDNSQGAPAAPSASGNPSAQVATASRDFLVTYPSLCASVYVNAASFGGNAVDLFRLRSATGGPIVKAFASATGTLIVRSDFASTQQSSNVAIGSGWHNVELCGTVGTNTTWDLYRDGAKIVNAWAANTGTDPIGRIQIGDTVAKTWTINFDHVRVDLAPGEPLGPPTTPGKPSGQSQSVGTISLSWSASTSQAPPITYRVYRDGGANAVGQTTNTSFTDTGLAPGSTHTYTVDAVDSANNASAMSPPSDPITVLSQALFTDDFSSGDFSKWASVTRLSIDTSAGGAAPPSAAGSPSALSAFAYSNLPSTVGSACASVAVNATSLGGNAVDLFRLRTATGGPIVKAFVNASGVLIVRSDFAGTQQTSGVALGSGWHTVKLCGTVGSNTTWDLYRDGTKIVNAWTADTGTVPIGRIQIGDTAAKTWTANFDDVRVD
jgi:chitodextrinase